MICISTHGPRRLRRLPPCVFFLLCLNGQVALLTATLASPPVSPSEALSPLEQRAKFQLPPGFEIQLVACEPEIQKPMNMAFDARGRLWVTHSVEYPFAAPEGTTPRDGLTILEGIGPDGRATKATLFADGLNIPIGVLPLPRGADEQGDSAIVWSIPNIWKLTDTDGDGQADSREVLYGPFDYVDTHGDQNSFRLGPDGWVYACHGFRNASKVKLRGEGGVVVEMTSGHSYRFRPDGSAIEKLTSGQVNPFGMDVDARGNQFTADCHSKPITMLLRGGCYESFGKPHDGLGFAPQTTGNDHGSTGIAGMVVYEANQFPTDYQGSAFVGNVITNVVHRDRFQWRGSSPWVEKPEDFLVCDDWWFRPVDLQLGPDGALYIADFYNCIIGHYEVELKHPRRDRTRGRIWRVVWKPQDSPQAKALPPAPPVPADISNTSPDALLSLLADPNRTVRRLASEQIAARFAGDPQTIQRLREALLASDQNDHAGALGRSAAVQTLARLDRLDSHLAARLVHDPAPVPRVHLVKALGDLPGWNSTRADLVRGRLADQDPFVRRAAAEALAAHPASASIPPLLAAWAAAASDDTQLIQALRIAVRNQLRQADPVEIAALPLDDAAWLRLVDVAATIPQDAIAWFAFGQARDRSAPADLLARCFTSVAHHCGDARLDEAARYARQQNHTDDLATEAGLFQPLLDGWNRRGQTLTATTELGHWGAGLADRVLAVATAAGDTLGPPPSAVSLALNLAAQLKLVPLAGQSLQVVADSRLAADVRATAATTALVLDRGAALTVLRATLSDGSQPLPLRDAIVRRLADVDSPEARAALAAALPTAPAALQQPIAVALATRPDGAELLLATVATGKASARLLQDKPVLNKLKAASVADLDRRLGELTKDLAPADKELEKLIARVATDHAKETASLQQGAAVFRRICANCHRFGGEGAAIGPQLDGVGQRGPQRLLEDILDPNRNVDEAFRMITVTTTDGHAISGLKVRDEGGGLVLADATGKEIRIAAADIDELVGSRLSPMPSNMAAQIGEENLSALLAYLTQPR